MFSVSVGLEAANSLHQTRIHQHLATRLSIPAVVDPCTLQMTLRSAFQVTVTVIAISPLALR
jgi:hypothetical protein